MFAVSCDNASKITINSAPDGTIEGALRITVLSGDGTFEQDPASPLSFKAVSGTAVIDPLDPTGAAGQTVFGLSADVRTGTEEVLIEDQVVLTVTAVPAAEATTFGFSVGAVEPKTPAAPGATARGRK